MGIFSTKKRLLSRNACRRSTGERIQHQGQRLRFATCIQQWLNMLKHAADLVLVCRPRPLFLNYERYLQTLKYRRETTRPDTSVPLKLGGAQWHSTRLPQTERARAALTACATGSRCLSIDSRVRNHGLKRRDASCTNTQAYKPLLLLICAAIIPLCTQCPLVNFILYD